MSTNVSCIVIGSSPPDSGGSRMAAATISIASKMGATTTAVADVEPNTSAITAIITGAVMV